MTAEPEVHQDSVNSRLVNYLAAQKESIMTDWLGLVHGDPAILLTETLNTTALKNRLPHIFDDLMDTLRRYGSETVAQQTVKDAGKHGATRMRQGYELSEMLRELKHLRSLLIYHFHVFEDLNSEDSMPARVVTSTMVHGFLDEMAISATEEYLSQANLRDAPSAASAKW